VQSAEAYREQTVAEATGQTARFNKIYEEYKKAPEVTRQRLYLETMERLFGGTDKVILDSSTQGSGVVPYLPLPELRKAAPVQTPQPATGGNR
jgi:membrane protease subunit HflK